MAAPKDKEKICNKVFEMISTKGMSVRDVFKKDVGVKRKTFYEWMKEDKELSDQYARAMQERADVLLEDIITIADDQEGDVYTDANGLEQTNHNVINRARLRVDARKWAASKMHPKKYGKKIDHTTDGEKIQQIVGMQVK